MPKNKGNIRKTPINSPKDLSAVYSNLVNVSSNKNEVFFDFITVGPHDAKVVSRVIMSLNHTKEFAKILNNFGKKLK